MIYSILLLTGFLGLLAQTLLGISHGHAGHTHGGHTHAGHTHGGQGHHHSPHPGVQGKGRAVDRGGQLRGPSPLWLLFSPLTLFSFLMGTGATGLLLRHYHLAPIGTAAAACAGGVFFYGLIVRPTWTFIFQFASTPSRALEGAVAAPAEAVSRFDARGQGVVRVAIDGQSVRLLARLESGDVGESTLIRPGDRLVVTSIDGHANTCRVTRL